MVGRKNVGSIPVDVCTEVIKNMGLAIPLVRAWRLKRPRAGAVFANRDQDLERYAFFGVRSLLDILGDVKGLDVIEIGPGDYLTSGLSFLAAGAASYTAIDRFPGDHSGSNAKKWYRGIQVAWPRIFPAISWPDYLNAENFPDGYPERVRVIPLPIEDVPLSGSYDVVCSFQVGEHVSDIRAFAELNVRLLRPGGTAVHRVDFGPHGCWEAYSDPLTFLRFPDWLWRLMGSHRGMPNRIRHHEFRAALESAGLKVETINLECYERDKIDYQQLNSKFRNVRSESLLVSAATYVCRQ